MWMREWTERMIDSIGQPPYYKYPSSQEVMIQEVLFKMKSDKERKVGKMDLLHWLPQIIVISACITSIHSKLPKYPIIIFFLKTKFHQNYMPKLPGCNWCRFDCPAIMMHAHGSVWCYLWQIKQQTEIHN